MVVLPEPLREQARRHPLLRGLYVTDAGYFPTAADHLVERPQGAPTTLAVLCLRGEGWVQLQGRRREIRPGDFAWLPARQAHAYGAAAGAPWTIAWAHFAGDEVASWRTFLETCAGSDDAVWTIPGDHVDEVALERVYRIIERGQAPRHQIAAASELRSSFSRLAEVLIERRGLRSARDRVAASIEGLRRDSSRAYRLEELASAAGMSVTHYCAHFRKVAGFAPIDFLIRLRVQHACRLLDTSRLTIAEVAAIVGYADAYYFTRCFRRVMGCSPQRYRQVPKG